MLKERAELLNYLRESRGFLGCLVVEKGTQSIDKELSKDTLKRKDVTIQIVEEGEQFVCRLISEKKDTHTAQESTQLSEKETTHPDVGC